MYVWLWRRKWRRIKRKRIKWKENINNNENNFNDRSKNIIVEKSQKNEKENGNNIIFKEIHIKYENITKTIQFQKI